MRMDDEAVADRGWPGPEDLLTVAEAARIAGKSVRTVRRAYRSGRLTAFRNGNGRDVHIRFRDLRSWMMARPAVRREIPADRPTGRIPEHRNRRNGPSENLMLLRAARQLQEPRRP